MTAFYVYNVLEHRVMSISWTAEQAARSWAEYPHRLGDAISELPRSMGIDIFNCVNVPAMIFTEGMKRYNERNAK